MAQNSGKTNGDRDIKKTTKKTTLFDDRYPVRNHKTEEITSGCQYFFFFITLPHSGGGKLNRKKKCQKLAAAISSGNCSSFKRHLG